MPDRNGPSPEPPTPSPGHFRTWEPYVRTYRTRRSAATAAASFLLLTGAAIATAPAASAGTPGGTSASDRNCDFNGDGYEDVLIGAPGASVGSFANAGLVTVQYGSRAGLDTSHADVFSRNSEGVEGPPASADRFGAAVASGDLDSDGYDDAIIGIPGDDHSAVSNAGGVVILWGSADGLSGSDSTWLGPSDATQGGHFGTSLAAARLSAATPGDVLAVLDRQDVQLFTYTPDGQGAGGLAATAHQGRWAARRLDVGAQDTEHTLAPTSLTTGDYDASGYSDLVVSGVTKDAAAPGRGWSAYLAGSADGPLWARDLRGGPVAASGDINGDGYDDLVTGEPDPVDDDAGQPTGGVVAVHYGGPAGPGPDTPVQYWTQDSAHVPGVPESGDEWGADLSVGDTDDDGYADVAIGAPGEDRADASGGAVADAGSVTVLRGTADGLTGTGARSWSQDTAGVPGTVEKGDRWGAQVRLVDPDGNRRFDLLAAAPGENAGDGGIWLLPAASDGITTTGSWTYGLGALGSAHRGAAYGAAIDE